MSPTLHQKYGLAVVGVSTLAALNGLWLLKLPRDAAIHSSPLYPGYSWLRGLLLQPGSILLVAAGFAAWLGLLYWTSRSRPLSDRHKIAVLCILLATVYGYLLTAWFKL